MTKPTALITGVTGQDGSYLAEFLLDKGYKVFGMERRHSTSHRDNIEHLLGHPDFETIFGDMTDAISLSMVVNKTLPVEIYNLAAQSFVHLSWSQPCLTNRVNYIGFLNLLEATKGMPFDPKIYQASSSEMFGNQLAPQNEETQMTPRSPYGVSKLASHRIAKVYRESFDMFIACGICFNHESPRRGIEFVTRKIAHAAAGFAKGTRVSALCLGNIEACRDWGYAPDYIEAMWLMLQQSRPDDYVLATGESHSVGEFLDRAFELVDVRIPGRVCIGEAEHIRPAEVHDLLGDASKAKDKLGWEPKISFNKLVEIMVNAELDRL